MSTFTLAISCFTTSNLPWFMDLTFQVPLQYCSLQHWTLLLSPVTSTTGYCFCFGFILSLFLELFLHWSPVAYWAPTDLAKNPIILPLHTVHGVLKARILKWFFHSLLQCIRMCIRIWYLSFYLWLTSLCVIGSRFIHLNRTDSNVFLFVAE